MPFAAGLRESLEIRSSQIPLEFTRGDCLEHVLNRHLLAVEQNFDGELITSILLLSADGKRLAHGAGPNLPLSYREAIDGAEIGPCAGSCGTAAYLGRPVYVTDISTDPLWANYRHIALPHGFRSCWSTPIRDARGSVIGTFATYHRTVGAPTQDEIDAIELITELVAHAILWDRGGVQDLDPTSPAPKLTLVDDSPTADSIPRSMDRLLQHVEKLETLVADLDRQAELADSESLRANFQAAAADSRRLISAIRHQIEHGGKPGNPL
jgi:hypothetical protein